MTTPGDYWMTADSRARVVASLSQSWRVWVISWPGTVNTRNRNRLGRAVSRSGGRARRLRAVNTL